MLALILPFASAMPPFLVEVVALIVAAALIAYVSFRLGLVPIVGFLLAGVLIGPNALGLVRDRAIVDAAAEVGVILLLYTIGIEFSLEKLWKIKRLIFGGGGLQVGLATMATAGLLALFGVGWKAGLFTGFLVALSSTAIVLKLLADRGEMETTHGQVGLGLLIFQDLAVVVMVLLVPMLGGAGGSLGGIVWALAKAGAIIAAVLLLARRFMPKLLELVARTCSPEIFLLSVIAVCFGTAYLTSLAGVSLSLGAFLAGLLVSESRFSEYALGEILPIQVLFSATFFVSVGMLLDVGFFVRHLPLVLGAIVAVLLIKAVTTGAAVAAIGFRAPAAAASALMLAQVGEFSFVLERAGREVGLSPAGMGEAGSQAFIAATVVLMVATPLLTSSGAALARRLEARSFSAAAAVMSEAPLPEHLPDLENHVVVAGYGAAARRLVRVLAGSGIPFVITTLSPEGANEAEADGLPVLRGDYARQRTLQAAGAERAKLLVVADDDPATARRVVAVARTVNPTMRIVVRTRWIAEIEPLTAAGADLVVAEELESVVALFSDLLRSYDIPAEEIEEHEEAIRRGGYAALRSPERPAEPVVRCEFGDECFHTRTVTIRAGAPAAGRTLADLALARFGIEVREVRRGGEELPVAPDLVLEPGDELVLAGGAEAFAAAAPLFRAAEPGDEGEGEDEAPRPLVDTQAVVTLQPTDGASCAHRAQIRPVVPSAPGCEECLASGEPWVHLRLCMTCGHVGCCDTSRNKHATAHFHATTHPIIRSLEPGDTWGWCYVDRVTL